MTTHLLCTYKVVTNDHGDGYCSGEDCEEQMTVESQKEAMTQEEKLLELPVGVELRGKVFDQVKRRLDRVEPFNDNGSGYCYNPSTKYEMHTKNWELMIAIPIIFSE